jgi:5-methylcytosine-specific restriction endonuclease McrA
VKRPCLRCGEPTAGSYCTSCAPTRPPRRPRTYRGAKWERLRRRYLKPGTRCTYCGAPATELDHVYPHSKGGPTIASNLVPACKPCNSRKRDRIPTETALRILGDDGGPGGDPEGVGYYASAPQPSTRSLTAPDVPGWPARRSDG